MYFMYWFLLLFFIFCDAQAMLGTGENGEKGATRASEVNYPLIVLEKTKTPQFPQIPEKDINKVCFTFLQFLEKSENQNDKIFAQQMRSYMRLMIGAFEKNIALKKLNLNVIMYSYARLPNNEIKKMVISKFQCILRRWYIDCGMLDVHGFTVPLQSDQNLIEVYFDTFKVLGRALQT